MTDPQQRRPGDRIIDRVAPHLTGADRDRARAQLEGLAGILVRIAIRQVREERAAARAAPASHAEDGAGDSPQPGPGDRMDSLPRDP